MDTPIIHVWWKMPDSLSDPTIQAATGVLVVLVVAWIAFFLMSRLRDYTSEDREDTPELLANFEEMRLKGEISEEEFRTITSATHCHVLEDVTDDDSPPNSGESPES